jgi:hypothetical protein
LPCLGKHKEVFDALESMQSYKSFEDIPKDSTDPLDSSRRVELEWLACFRDLSNQSKHARIHFCSFSKFDDWRSQQTTVNCTLPFSYVATQRLYSYQLFIDTNGTLTKADSVRVANIYNGKGCKELMKTIKRWLPADLPYESGMVLTLDSFGLLNDPDGNANKVLEAVGISPPVDDAIRWAVLHRLAVQYFARYHKRSYRMPSSYDILPMLETGLDHTAKFIRVVFDTINKHSTPPSDPSPVGTAADTSLSLSSSVSSVSVSGTAVPAISDSAVSFSSGAPPADSSAGEKVVGADVTESYFEEVKTPR